MENLQQIHKFNKGIWKNNTYQLEKEQWEVYTYSPLLPYILINKYKYLPPIYLSVHVFTYIHTYIDQVLIIPLYIYT